MVVVMVVRVEFEGWRNARGQITTRTTSSPTNINRQPIANIRPEKKTKRQHPRRRPRQHTSKKLSII